MFGVSIVTEEGREILSVGDRERGMMRDQFCPQSDTIDEGNDCEELLDPDPKPLLSLLVTETVWELVNVPPLDLLDLAADSWLEVELLQDPGNHEQADSFES